MKYSSVDQALESINFQELGTTAVDRSSDIKREVKNAFRPMLDTIYQSQLSANTKEEVVNSIVETTVPTLLRTFSKHWSSIRAA